MVTINSAQGETGNFRQCLGHEVGDSAGLLDPVSRCRVHHCAEVRVVGVTCLLRVGMVGGL